MALQSDHEFAPTDIARAVFPTAFRGYDQDAVRRYLSRLAAALEHRQAFDDLGELEARPTDDDRVEELEAEIATLQEEIRELETELVQRSVDEADQGSRKSSAAVEFDEHRAIELLGQETARVLESARSAAADILKRAETQAAGLKSEAKKELTEARREAKRLVAERQAEAAAAIDELTEAAEQSANRIRREAEEHRSAVVDESAKILADAETQAEAEQADAEERARQIVADAEALRHQVVAELVAERKAGQAAVDGLVEARDRLAMSLAVARSELDQLGDDLAAATDDRARRNDGSAVEVDGDEVARLIERLDAGTAGLDRTAAPAGSETSGGRRSGVDRSDGPVTSVDEPTEEMPAVDARAIDGDDDLVDAGVFDLDSAGDRGRDDTGSTAGPDHRDDIALAGDPVPDRDRASELAPGSALDETVDGHEIDLDGSPGSDDQINARPLNGVPLSLVEGFSTIVLDDIDIGADTDTGTEATTATARPDQGGDGSGLAGTVGARLEEPTEPSRRITTVSARLDGRPAGRAQGDLLVDQPSSERLPTWFGARDVAVTRAGANLRRQLRRALNDDQSDVLDRLRQGRGAITVDELRPTDEQIDHYLKPLRRGLTDLAVAGARAGGGDQPDPASLDNLVEQLAAYVVDRVRTPTVAAIAEADHVDRERILEPIRSGYRDFRNLGLPDLLTDALNEAYAIGLYDSIEDGSLVSWQIDPRTDPDPVCEVNRDRSGLVKGETFPSGHVRPLALPGCRCLVIGTA